MDSYFWIILVPTGLVTVWHLYLNVLDQEIQLGQLAVAQIWPV